MDIEILNLGRVVGFSAYELAVQQGFEGTLNEWLESLKYVSSDEYKQLVAQVEEAKKQIESTLTSVNLKTEELVNLVTQSLTDIATSKTQALSDIKTLHDSAIRNISSAETTATDNISSAVVAALNELSIALSTAKTGISESGSTWKKHIEDSGVLATDSVNDAKTQALEEITAAKDTSSIELAKNQAIEEINKAKDVTAIETAKTEAVKAVKAAETAANESINTQKTTSIEEIKTEGNTQVELIKSTMESELSKKLDKNLGTNNGNKVLTTDSQGNIVLQDKEDFEGSGVTNYNELSNRPSINGVTLTGNKTSADLDMYTKEEVDEMLYEKMDKPYVPITISDNTTIEDCLDGYFKINKIRGNTYQAQETDIVPTPSRAVPINSRKVKAGDSYVELRSLKESVNIWDNTNIASYDGEAIVFKKWAKEITNLETSFIELKPNTKYTVKMDIEMVEAIEDEMLTQFSLSKKMMLFRSSTNEFGLPAVNTNLGEYSSIMINGEVQSVSATITTPEDLRGVSILGYTERWLDDSNKAYFANVKFKNIMLVEGNSAPSSYVAPTVRDYKIVDHTNKTAKIVRNVQEINLNNLNFVYNDTKTDYSRFYASVNPALKYAGEIYSNVFPSYDSYDYTKESIYSGNSYGGKVLSIIVKDSNVTEHTQEALLEYINNPNAIVYYALETPTEESITYVETDVNEVGYSWQDTTSPSPTIKSEVKGVEEIDILKTGKNLFDINDEDVYLSPNITHNGNQIIKNDGSIFPRIKLKNLVIDKEYTLSYSTKLNKSISNGQLLSAISSKNMGYPNGVVLYKVGDGGTDYNVKIKFTATQSEMYLIFSVQPETITNLQIELGDTATAYEPYTEQRVNIALPQPLYQNDIVNIESGEYEYCTKNTTIDFNRFDGNLDLIQDNTVRYYFHKSFAQELDGIILDTLLFDCFRKVDDDSDTIHFKIGGVNNEYIFMFIPRGPIDNKAYAKEYLSSLNLIANFAVETKTTQPIPEEDLAKMKSLKTNAGVNNIFVGGEVKPTIEARYPQDVVSAVNTLQTRLLTLQEEVIKNV